MPPKAWRHGEKREEIRPDGSKGIGTPRGEYSYDPSGNLLGHLNMTGGRPLYEKPGRTCYGCLYWDNDEAELEDEKPCYWCAVGFTEDGTLGGWASRKTEVGGS